MSTEAAELAPLHNRHRLEEACEPFGLYPEFPEPLTLRLPEEQLGLTDGLGEFLLGLLVKAGVDCELQDAGLTVSLPTRAKEVRAVARALSNALYEGRSLHPQRFLARRGRGSLVPHASTSLDLPRSRAFMGRTIAGDFMPDDKKPPVLDLFRSSGPYLASIDAEPLVMFDAASQIASHAGGLNPPTVLEALYTGKFSDFALGDDAASEKGNAVLEHLGDLLLTAAGDEIEHITFCNSGAEANEVALRIAAHQNPGRKTVIAFEGAFHGRTMWALHATWNPAKRLRFEFDDFKARWVHWPRWDGTADASWDPATETAPWCEPAGAAQRTLPEHADALARAEFESLTAVEAGLEQGDVVAILVEPMQSEGGDGWCTERFFACLRGLALAYAVPFIVDEVQTGFHLGGPFFWHRGLRLPAAPDLITSAKKCQVGAVCSRWPIHFPCETSVTSAVRGICQSEMVSEEQAQSLQARALEKLGRLASSFPELVIAPRSQGYAFAFDLPSPADMQHVIQERMWRGYMVYGAGNRTLRFRLNAEMRPASLDALFVRLHDSLTTLRGGSETSWQQVPLPDEARPWPGRPCELPEGMRCVEVPSSHYGRVQDELTSIEEATYEPARQDDMARFGRLLAQGGQCIVVLDGDGGLGEATVVAMAFSFPLEMFGDVEGPRSDPSLGTGRTLYSADISVHPDHRGKGLGLALKQAQVTLALTARADDGTPRYDFMTGRNRLGATDAMQSINERFGAWRVELLPHQYGGGGDAEYYRIPLCAPRLPHVPTVDAGSLNLSDGLSHRLRHRPDSDSPGSEPRESLIAGHMNGAIANKLSLCNFVTPGVARSMEMLRELAPQGMRHLVVSNGRSEMFDKGLRALKFHRPQGRVVISLGPVFAGETTAASRSISRGSDDPENIFQWPSCGDPTTAPEEVLTELETKLTALQADTVLAVVMEPLFAQTGRLIGRETALKIRALCSRFGVPLAVIENTTGLFRNAMAPWLSDAWDLRPDVLFYFPGGQLGLTYLADGSYVPDKLTLISTWDGDEVSLTRLLWEVRALETCDLAGASRLLEGVLSKLGSVEGAGLARSVEVEAPGRLIRFLRERGISITQTACGALKFVPHLNISDSEIATLEGAIDAYL